MLKRCVHRRFPRNLTGLQGAGTVGLLSGYPQPKADIERWQAYGGRGPSQDVVVLREAFGTHRKATARPGEGIRSCTVPCTRESFNKPQSL